MKNALAIVIISLGVLLAMPMNPVHSADCWTYDESKYFAEQELDGNLMLSFKNAATCDPIARAELRMLGTTWQTDRKGTSRSRSIASKNMRTANSLLNSPDPTGA